MSVCKNICLRYKKSARFDTNDSKFCQFCSIYLEFSGRRCPCCNSYLRNKPKTPKRQRIFYKNFPKKEPPRI